MSSEATAVIAAAYTGERRVSERVTSPGGRPIRDTFYTFELIEVIKPDSLLPPPGELLELDLPGGDKEYATYIDRQRQVGSEPLRPGHQYVIFLEYLSAWNRLGIKWGPSGVFDVTNGRVRSLNTDGSRHDGKGKAEFIGEARTRR